MKYFCEEAKEYHVVCAGSLLDIRLSRTSFLVGKVDFLSLNPMTFSEFLLADGCDNLVEVMKKTVSVNEIPSIFHNQLIEKIKI